MAALAHLRPAERADAERLWQWRNDPETRRVSLDTAPIPWEKHVSWLESQLLSPDTALFVIEDERGNPCGQLRLNKLPQGGALVSIGLAREVRGQGLGASALRAVQLSSARPGWATVLYAVIKQGNEPSRRAFEAAGFAGPSPAAAAAVGQLENGTGVWFVELESQKPRQERRGE